MIKKTIYLCLALLLSVGSLSAFEIGLTAGTMNKTPGSGFHYGLAAGGGLLVPMLKFEVELFKIRQTDEDLLNATVDDYPAKKNAASIGIKFRPKLGKFSPYAIAGLGWECDKFGLTFSKYNKFSFVGGGIHYHLMPMISIRGDIRFLNYSDVTKTRLSAGLFVSI